MDEDLIRRLRDVEDGFTERKTEGSANASELRKTLVAFANSVAENKTAILFIGVSNDGNPIGVDQSDQLQRKIRDIAEKVCYPKVNYQIRVFELETKKILAVLVGASNERPHFSGPAFVRIGSESVAASPQVYEELIDSRNSNAGQILRNKGNLITLKQIDLDRWGRHKVRWSIQCRIEGCDAHVVHFHDIASGRNFSEPLKKIRINFDSHERRMMLEVIGE